MEYILNGPAAISSCRGGIGLVKCQGSGRNFFQGPVFRVGDQDREWSASLGLRTEQEGWGKSLPCVGQGIYKLPQCNLSLRGREQRLGLLTSAAKTEKTPLFSVLEFFIKGNWCHPCSKLFLKKFVSRGGGIKLSLQKLLLNCTLFEPCPCKVSCLPLQDDG